MNENNQDQLEIESKRKEEGRKERKRFDLPSVILDESNHIFERSISFIIERGFLVVGREEFEGGESSHSIFGIHIVTGR